MADNNRVLFGFSRVIVGTFEVDPDTKAVTMGEPYAQVGAVGFSPEPADNDETAYADNIAWFTDNSSPTRSGDLVVMKYDRAFKQNFLGYVESAAGGIAEVVNPVKPNVYIGFQVEGDKESRRIIMYNGTLGSINREYNTIEDARVPVTESIATKFIGDEASGIICDTLEPGDAGYDDFFTSPPAPARAGESES